MFVRKFQSIAKHHVPAIFNRWYFFNNVLMLVLVFHVALYIQGFEVDVKSVSSDGVLQ